MMKSLFPAAAFSGLLLLYPLIFSPPVSADTIFGNPSTSDNTGYTCTPYDIGPTPTPSGSAPQCSCTDTYFCKGSVWSSTSEIWAKNECDGERRTEICNTKDDYFCTTASGSPKCVKHYTSSIVINPSTPTIGEIVNATVWTSRSCYPTDPWSINNYTFYPGQALRLPGDFTRKVCRLDDTGCNTATYGTPQACWWKFSCSTVEAFDPIYYAAFGSVVTFEDPFEGSCNAVQTYTINTTTACNSTESTVPYTLFYNERELIAPATEDTDKRVTTMYNVLMPEPVRQELAANPQQDLPKTGVESGLFAQIKNLFCQSFIARILGSWYCPVDVNLAFSETDYYINKARVISATERPPEVKPTPAQQTCYLSDMPLGNSSTTDGNLKISNLNTYLGTGDGIYSANVPEEVKVWESTAQKTDYKKRGNVVIRGQALYGDERSPDIELMEDYFDKSNYLYGITPLRDGFGP